MRALRRVLIVVAILLALPALAVGGVLLFLNTSAGARIIEQQTTALTGGMVQVFGVAAALPSGLRIGRIEIHDADGLWLSIEDAALDWRPSRLLAGVADVTTLTARRIAVLRLPNSSGGDSGGSGFTLPVEIQARHVAVQQIDIAAPVAGTPLELALTGHAQARALDDFAVDAAIRDVAGTGAYDAHLILSAAIVDLRLSATEPAHGAVSRIAGLPELGALSLLATVAGPRRAALTHVTLAAGALRAAADGQVDVDTPAATLDLTATAPAMTPAPGIGFGGVDLAAHVTGPLASPQATGRLVVTDLAAGGAQVRRLAASLSGNPGKAEIQAVAEAVRVPGPQPGLIERDPVHASAEITLSNATKPVLFTLSHPLLAVSGHGTLAPSLTLAAHVTAPDLAPFAAIGGVALRGSSALDLAVTQASALTLNIDGTIGLTAGPGPSAALIGPAARLGVTAQLGQETVISRLTLDGAALRLAATGQAGAKLKADATVTLPQLQAVAPTLGGALTVHLTADGTPTDLDATADLAGDIATPGVPTGHVTAKLLAHGLPDAPSGRITAEGTLDGAPLSLDATAARDATGATSLKIDRADWRSAHAEGAVSLASGATLPLGHLALRMTRLADAQRLSGLALSGSVQATVDLTEGKATARVLAERAGLPGTSVNRATLDARVDDPLGAARVDARMVANGVQAGGTTSDATVTLRGTRAALAVQADARAALAGGPASLSTRAMLDADRRSVAISTLQAEARGLTLRLLAPARVSFGDSVSVDRLRLGLREAVLDVAGRVSPTLDLTASLRNLHPDVITGLAPSLAADGVVSAEARLTGSAARPTGTVKLEASGLRMRSGPASTLAPIAVTADATLTGRQARVDAKLTEGRNGLTLTGTAPIDPAAALDLHLAGDLDLMALDPLLAASGRRIRGQVAINAGVGGTLSAPTPSGTIRLSHGEVQDFGQGLHLDHIEAGLTGNESGLTIDHFDAHAGTGTISASGSVGVAGTMPLDLRITARHATPLASDLLTARLDADLTARGTLQDRIDLGGKVTVQRADIRVPDKLPASVPVLQVVVPGAKPPAPAAPPLVVGLALTITSPGQIFVRGRGIDAELAGDLRIGGTSAQPLPQGGFTLRRGSYSLAGTTLTFTSGSVSFNGASRIDPSLNFVATSSSGNVTATLTVTGTASDPKIALSSVPDLPQDEILAHLLFGQSAASLSPFQLAQIAAAVAQLSGVAGGGFDPLNAVRQGLGLDRLSVAGGGNGSAPDVEAGRYVAPGIYVGARQATSGGGTQAVVQIDIARGLKLESSVGTGGGSAQGAAQSGAASNGTGLGLTYQFQY